LLCSGAANGRECLKAGATKPKLGNKIHVVQTLDRNPTPACIPDSLFPWAALIALLAIGATLRCALFSGTLGNDEIRHAYNAYFLTAPDEVKRAVVNWHDDTPYRRMGINLPLWLVMQIFGVSDASMSLVPLAGSLLGITVVFFMMKHLEGLAAAILGGGIYALLPLDVYMGTIWLQDTIFVAVLSMHIYFLIRAIEAQRGRRFAWALAAGLALGYLQFVKEYAILVLAVVGVWVLVRLFCREWRALYVLLAIAIGHVAVQAAMLAVFWPRHPEVLWYWRESLAVMLTAGKQVEPLSNILYLVWYRLTQMWLFGYLVVAFPVAAIVALASRRTRHRLIWLVLLLTQAGVLYGAMKNTQGQTRYMLQLALPFIVLTTIGIWRLIQWSRISLRPTLAGLLILACCGATAGALRPEHQQFHADRTRAVRGAHQFAHRWSNRLPIFAADAYTMRLLYQFNRFEPFTNGLFDLGQSLGAPRGLVVLSFHEHKWMGRHPPTPPPKNWAQIFAVDGPAHWARVYRIRGPAKLPSSGRNELLRLGDPEQANVEFASGDLAPVSLKPDAATGALKLLVTGAGPHVLLLKKKGSYQIRCPGAWTDPEHPRMLVVVKVKASAPLEVRAGLRSRTVNMPRMGEIIDEYGESIELSERMQEVRFEKTFDAQTYAYGIPLVRFDGPDDASIHIRDIRFYAMPDTSLTQPALPTSNPQAGPTTDQAGQ